MLLRGVKNVNEYKTEIESSSEYEKIVKKIPFNCNTIILSKTLWVNDDKPYTIDYPIDFVLYQNVVEKVFIKNSSHRTLKWLPTEGYVILGYLCPQSRKEVELQVSPVQAYILLWFNEHESGSIQEISQDLNIRKQLLPPLDTNVINDQIINLEKYLDILEHTDGLWYINYSKKLITNQGLGQSSLVINRLNIDTVTYLRSLDLISPRNREN